jgi:hypothetical protein
VEAVEQREGGEGEEAGPSLGGGRPEDRTPALSQPIDAAGRIC